MLPVAVGAQRDVDPPGQIEPFPVIVHTGGFEVTVWLQVLLHPPFVTLTEYVPAAVTFMQPDVTPVLHK